MYPLHPSYTTTLPCKTITMKITFFHRGNWIATNCSDFIGKDEWPPNSPDLNPLDYHVWGAMLKRYKTFQPKPKLSTSWRKSCKQYGMICHRTPSTRPYWALQKVFELMCKLGADTLNTSWNKLFLQCFELLASCDSLECQISMFSIDFNTSTMMKIVIFYSNCFTR